MGSFIYIYNYIMYIYNYSMYIYNYIMYIYIIILCIYIIILCIYIHSMGHYFGTFMILSNPISLTAAKNGPKISEKSTDQKL